MSKKVTITNEVSMLEFAGKLSDGSTEKTMSELLAGGGTKKYAHFITWNEDNAIMTLLYIDGQETQYTYQTFAQALQNGGYNSSSNLFRTIFSGMKWTSVGTGTVGIVEGVYASSNIIFYKLDKYTFNFNTSTSKIDITYDSGGYQATFYQFSDHVVPLS